MKEAKIVSEDQIKKLFIFTRSHFVEYLDVQIELVDHLASSIEDTWKDNPDISFDHALKSSFKKFGVFGFDDVVTQKQNELEKKYRRQITTIILNKLRWPEILSSLAFAVVLFLITKFLNNSIWPSLVTFTSAIIYLLVFSVINNRKWRKKLKKIKLLSIQSSNLYPWIYINLLIQLLLQLYPRILMAESGSYFSVSNPIIYLISFINILFFIVMYESIAKLDLEIENNIKKYTALSL